MWMSFAAPGAIAALWMIAFFSFFVWADGVLTRRQKPARVRAATLLRAMYRDLGRLEARMSGLETRVARGVRRTERRPEP